MTIMAAIIVLRLVLSDLAARNVFVTTDGLCKIADFCMTRRMIKNKLSILQVAVGSGCPS